MSDEFPVDPANRPRFEPIPGGGEAFIHPCSICGGHAPFGYEVSIAKGRPGIWRCREHRVDNLQTKASTLPKSKPVASAPKPVAAPVVKTPPKPVPAPDPKQGDLF